MKNLLFLSFIFLLFWSCDDARRNEKVSSKPIVVPESNFPAPKASVNNAHGVTYEINAAKWKEQPKDKIVDYFEQLLGERPAFTPEQIVGVYTKKNQADNFTYPFIMILDNTLQSGVPDIEAFAQQLKALPADLSKKAEGLKGYTKDLEFKQPILVKEKNLLLMETIAGTSDDLTLVVRQGMFFKGQRVVAVQFSYVENRDEEYLEDFSQIIETLKF